MTMPTRQRRTTLEARAENRAHFIAYRAQVIEAANNAGRESRSPGAPVLCSTSTRREVTLWLQWCDPNGCHTQELFTLENGGGAPYGSDSDAWDAVMEMVEA